MNDTKAIIDKIVRDLEQISFVHIALIIIGAWLLIKIIDWIFPWLAEKVSGRLRLYILPTVPVLRLFILFIAVTLIAPLVIKPTFQNLVLILGTLGLAIGFAFKEYVSGLIAGIVALYERPYRPGDWVKINGTYGEVLSLGVRSLRLTTPDDSVVTIPHTKIWDSNIYNSNDGKRELMCITNFYLHPHHDVALIRQKLYDVAITSPYIHLERPILVIVSEKPWGTHYRLKAYPIDSRDQFQLTTELTIRGKTLFAELGVSAAFPLPGLLSESPEET